MAVFSTACVSKRFNKRLAEAEKTVVLNQSLLTKSQANPQRGLTWQVALKKLQSQNLSYLRSKSSLAQIETSRKHFIKEQLNPSLRASSSLSTALGDIGNISSNNTGIRLLGSISIPNPVSLYASRYTLELQYYISKLDFTLLERRLQVALYTHFIQQELLEYEVNSPKESLKPNAVNISELHQRSQRIEKAAQTLAKRKSSIRLQLNRLLNTPGQNWKPLPKTLPDLSYASELSSLTLENGYGRIAIQQAAGQLESSFASIARIKVAQIPLLSTGVSLPTLYDSQQSGSNDFDIQDTRLFASLSKSFDLTGVRAMNTKRAKQRAEFIQHSIIQRLESEQLKLANLVTNYQNLIDDSARLKSELKWLDKSPPLPNGQQIIEYLQKKDQLKDLAHRNKTAQKQLDLQLWIWDDRKWPSLSF